MYYTDMNESCKIKGPLKIDTNVNYEEQITVKQRGGIANADDFHLTSPLASGHYSEQIFL